MTDKECLIQIINNLNLKIKNNSENINCDDYAIEDNKITIGSGGGYGGFIACFQFDENDKCISHELWE